eukprot:COSAG05_NODE_9424_length_624_cov_1.182857_2_plen_44_part_01
MVLTGPPLDRRLAGGFPEGTNFHVRRSATGGTRRRWPSRLVVQH